MTWQLANAKVWDGSQWVAAVGGGGPWWSSISSAACGRSLLSGIAVTAGTPAHTKGAWTELIASTSADADVLAVSIVLGSSATDTAALMDIGIGASGSETVIVSNVALGGHSAFPLLYPVQVPSGSRVSIRYQCVVASRSINTQIAALDTGTYSDAPASLTALGIDTATSTGTSLTNSTWVEVVASTSEAYSSVMLIPSITNAVATASQATVELGTGSSGAEVSRGSVSTTWTGAEQIVGTIYGTFIVKGPFASGTRFTVRTSAGGGGTLDACLIGLP